MKAIDADKLIERLEQYENYFRTSGINPPIAGAHEIAMYITVIFKDAIKDAICEPTKKDDEVKG